MYIHVQALLIFMAKDECHASVELGIRPIFGPSLADGKIGMYYAQGGVNYLARRGPVICKCHHLAGSSCAAGMMCQSAKACSPHREIGSAKFFADGTRNSQIRISHFCETRQNSPARAHRNLLGEWPARRVPAAAEESIAHIRSAPVSFSANVASVSKAANDSHSLMRCSAASDGPG